MRLQKKLDMIFFLERRRAQVHRILMDTAARRISLTAAYHGRAAIEEVLVDLFPSEDALDIAGDLTIVFLDGRFNAFECARDSLSTRVKDRGLLFSDGTIPSGVHIFELATAICAAWRGATLDPSFRRKVTQRLKAVTSEEFGEIELPSIESGRPTVQHKP